MTDLTFASFEEIQAELTRRYPAHILGVLYIPEGYKNNQTYPIRMSFGGVAGNLACMSLADVAYTTLKSITMQQINILPPNTPMDPPIIPPNVPK